MKKQRCLLHCVLAIITFAAGGLAARGQIALNNYNAVKPLKIMPLGDSITDDCVVNGSWRKPLQPLLEANGFPFTFVGRNTSTAATGFTKLKHEGHCGAVVAAPGILSDGRYTAALNYLQYIAPQASTNAIPDVMLILIGANDIGNGRNPWLVATNNVDTLLNIIFSNAPNVTVVLAQATGQENYPGLSVNGMNIPIYNAALQKLVNQRRTLGQKVCLADLYSVVTYPVNFSDGLHPNTNGMKQAANEWLTRLQIITIQTNLIVTNFICGGANWKYNDTAWTSAPTGRRSVTMTATGSMVRHGWAMAIRPGHDSELRATAQQQICDYLFPPVGRRPLERGHHQPQSARGGGGRRGRLAQWTGNLPHQFVGGADHLHEPGVDHDVVLSAV